MLRPCSRLVNFRFRGPLESGKVNRMKMDVSADLAVLEEHTAALGQKIAGLAEQIVTGEYADVRKAGTVPRPEPQP
jgi:hypothetical protein